MVGNCLSSKTKATDKFVAGFKNAYPASGFSDNQVRDIYGKVRCGLYHVAYTKTGVVISGGYSKTFAFNGGTIEFNPHLLIPDIRNHFSQFMATLKSKSDPHMIKQFEKMFKQ